MKVVKIALEVSTQRLNNKATLGYFEQIFFIEGYLVISFFRLIFLFKYNSLGRVETSSSQ